MNRLQRALYWPHRDDEQVLRISDRRPCTAVVSSNSTSSADLIVTDHFGNRFVRLNVPVHPDGPGREWCSIV